MLKNSEALPEFNNGRVLRDYQVESFKWMVQNNLKSQSCILGDEMGLGKTAQVCAIVPALRNPLHCCISFVDCYAGCTMLTDSNAQKAIGNDVAGDWCMILASWASIRCGGH
jgi:hypothetical protein